VSISRYEVDAESVKRIHRLALRPEDFLDEWVQLSWDDAKRWSNESMQSDLQAWHERLNGAEFASTEIKSLQPCPKQEGSDRKWMIDLWIDQKLNPSIDEERLRILVSQKKRYILC
jgi:hypothetical protein